LRLLAAGAPPFSTALHGCLPLLEQAPWYPGPFVVGLLRRLAREPSCKRVAWLGVANVVREAGLLRPVEFLAPPGQQLRTFVVEEQAHFVQGGFLIFMVARKRHLRFVVPPCCRAPIVKVTRKQPIVVTQPSFASLGIAAEGWVIARSPNRKDIS
jgi:hypothetical protein